MKYFFAQFLSLKIAGVVLLMISGAGKLVAQCDCDHTVGLDVRHFYGDKEGVMPGDVICVEGGTRGQLRFHNIEGSEAEPVVIKNCGGQVVIKATGGGQSNVPLSLSGNKFFHLTGTGDPDYEYGFKLGGEAHATVDAGGRATNFEIDHVEVFSSGFAGFMLKTDPDAGEQNVRPQDPDAVNGGFTMYDISVHHCYIHDCLPDGEGIYMGNSFWSSGKKRNGDPNDIQYPHSIYGAKIYNNIFERTGREAIQAGAVVEGLEIYNNRISEYGYKNSNGAQNNGIQIGEGSSGKIYNNFIQNGPDGGSRAIYLLGLGDNYVYNNVIIGAGNVAINANLRPSPFKDDPGQQGLLGGAYIINNTIIDTKGAVAFSTYLNDALENVLYNNLVITANDNWDGIVDGDWTKSNNLRYETIEEANLIEIDWGYRLLPGSGAIDAGVDVSAYDIFIDQSGTNRPLNGAYDAGAIEFDGQITTTPEVLGSIEETAEHHVYPNPMVDNVFIDIQDVQDGETVEIYLADTFGRKLKSRQIPNVNASEVIDLNIADLDLPAGIYYLNIFTETSREVKKMIKK